MLSVALVALLLAAPAVAGELSGWYLDLVESYRHGDRTQAVQQLWSIDQVREELERLRKLARDARKCRPCPQDLYLQRFPFEAAVMIQTDRALLERLRGSARGAESHLDLARDLVALIPDPERKGWLERRWLLAVTLQGHQEMDWAMALVGPSKTCAQRPRPCSTAWEAQAGRRLSRSLTSCGWRSPRPVISSPHARLYARSRPEAPLPRSMPSIPASSSRCRRARRLVMLFSDGEDNMSWLGEEQLRPVLAESDALVHVVGGPSSLVVSERSGGGGVTVEGGSRRSLRRLAEASGGRFWPVDSSGDLRRVFLNILRETRTRYVLSYMPTGVSPDGWHRVEVRLRGRKATVRHRSGYLRRHLR